MKTDASAGGSTSAVRRSSGLEEWFRELDLIEILLLFGIATDTMPRMLNLRNHPSLVP